MTFNPEIHHRHSIRLQGYDYSQTGAYFITICTHDRDCLFGFINDDEITKNEYGVIVEREWIKTSAMRLNIELDEFTIMPNHLHGIIIITECKDTMQCRGTMHRAPTVEQFGKPTSNTIPAIIRGFKSAVTKQINEMRQTPGVPVWQRNYFEHIIRDEKELHRIREYIVANPANWKNDDYYFNKLITQ